VLEVHYQTEREGLGGQVLENDEGASGVRLEGLDRGFHHGARQRQGGEEYRHHQR